MNRHTAWQPILTGRRRARALETVRAIATELAGPRWTRLDNPSLSSGCAGLALLFAYCGAAEPGDDDEEIAAQFLSRAVELLGETSLSPSLYGGFTGVAWTVEHLRGRLLEAIDDNPNEALDEALLDYLCHTPWEDDYDLIIGLVGIGVYALECLPRPAARECLKRVVDLLEQTAEGNSEGLTWHTRPELLPASQQADCPHGHYNLGLAHGVPGVIGLLGAVLAAGVERERARKLLDGAVRWLLQQKQPENADTYFASWIEPGGAGAASRLAWCYGDLGLSVALWRAAEHAHEPLWEHAALQIARRAAQRAPEDSGVVDACLCHGAAGVAHIFNRLFQATGETAFKRAARYWFNRALHMKRPNGAGVAGFEAYQPGSAIETDWFDDAGILIGAAGIALALLAAATSQEPEWDRIMLLSGPRRLD